MKKPPAKPTKAKPVKAKVTPKPTPKKAKPKPRRKASLAHTRTSIDNARRWYIQGLVPAEGKRAELRNPSLDDIAPLSGLHLCTIQRRSAEEGWVAQREAFARQAIDIENNRLLLAMSDQHARSRTAYFRSSMRLQTTIERKLATEGEALDMQDLSAAGSALAKAQTISDIAILGAKAAQGPVAQANVQVNLTGWAQISAPPSPSLQATLAALDAEEA